ncbi:hypothetical protein PSV08DRAFT_362653 [Bipolaris maydis]|uniref:uncharacterized protein n=1 Tax=Cochliobolus heterostrophus TaxID=5016 RepID=UPI0024D66CEB|nr:hypothetical protein J3E73DRAFT_381924 [Bipolaris maydis]KAJ6270092.1 hypothetical protein PSV08DRAFT_362653 [Bipolaris maydis]KAJ6283717.1 hypothetical protein J3E71DRAFT_377041 [Bipolaris maydis]
MSSDATSFHGLPAELMRDICDFLPLDALLALKLTAPRLNSTIRLDPRRRQDALSPCARRAIHSYLNPSLSKPDQQHCRLCNTAYSMAMFSSSASPACIPMKLTTTPHDVVQLPSNVCSWHVSRLARVIHTGYSGRNEWTSCMDDMCMHCGNIMGWTRGSCTCDSCGFWPVRTYTRYLNNSKECHRFLFWREASELADRAAGPLWVWEAYLDDDDGKLSNFCADRVQVQVPWTS